jgi:hypothetical protein
MGFIGLFSCNFIPEPDPVREAVRSVSSIIAGHIGNISSKERGRPWFNLI